MMSAVTATMLTMEPQSAVGSLLIVPQRQREQQDPQANSPPEIGTRAAPKPIFPSLRLKRCVASCVHRM